MKRFKQIAVSLLLVMLVMLIAFPGSANAAGSKPKKSKVTMKATWLQDKTVLLKVSNKNKQTISADIKLVYKNGETVIAEKKESVSGVRGKTTVYESISSSFSMKDDLEPTSVQVKFSLRDNYAQPQLKSIKNVVTAEITSVENYDYLTYQKVNVDFNNISKRNITGSVTVLFYSENKLVGSENQLLSIKKGETEFEDFVPMFYSDEKVNIDSIKLVQNDLRYN
jgi:hypothetical protein